MNAALWLILFRGGAYGANAIFGESVEFATLRYALVEADRGAGLEADRLRLLEADRYREITTEDYMTQADGERAP